MFPLQAKQSKENPNIFAPYVLRNIFDLVSSVDPVKTGLFQDFNDVSPFTFERQWTQPGVPEKVHGSFEYDI